MSFRRPRGHAVTDRPLSCREVGRLLQSFLDGAVGREAATRVAEHLEDCRRCGLETEVYREIKASLARRAPTLSEASLSRLRRFGDELADGDGRSPDAST